MSLGLNIAIGLGSAVVFRMISNAAFQSTLPQVDPNMPSAGPVLAAVGLPGAGAGLAYSWKYHKVASALAGIAIGAGISTAEYMAYARGAQSPAQLPAAQSYTWIVVHKDGSLDTVLQGSFDLAQVPMRDNEIVNKYGNDPDVIMIARKDAQGNQAVLAKSAPAMQAPQSIAIGEPMGGRQQSGAVVRMMMRR